MGGPLALKRTGAVRYGPLLRLPGVLRVLPAATLGRMPVPMATVAIILLVRETTGSFGAAGAVAGARALAGAVFATPLGRLVDRYGHSPTLPLSASINAAGAIGLVVAARSGAPLATLIAAGSVMGASTPPLPACMRALWPTFTGGGPRLEAAYAVEAALQEVLMISGPILAAGLVALASPDLALMTGAVLSLSGTMVFATSRSSRAQVGARSSAGRAGALASAGMRTLVIAMLPVAFCFGTLQVGIAAFAEQHGSPAAMGVMLACWGVGALASTLWYGRRRWRVDACRRYLVLLSLLPIGFLALGTADSLPAMAVLMVAAGMPAGPMHATSFSLIESVAPPGTMTEAFTVTRTALALGIALGASIAGGLVDTAGASAVLAGAAAVGLLAPLTVLLRRGTLGAPPPADGGRTRRQPAGGALPADPAAKPETEAAGSGA